MDCPKCGTHNLESAERCRICGASFLAEKVPAGPSKTCQFCKTPNDPDEPFCSKCGKYLGAIETETLKQREKQRKEYARAYSDYPASAQRTARAGVGGIIILMTAVFTLIDTGLTLGIAYEFTQWAHYDEAVTEIPVLKTALANMVACQMIRIVFVAIAFLGGLFAMRRLTWGLAMVGGILGILALISGTVFLVVPFWGLIELILFAAAIGAVAMIGISRKEFLLT